MPLAIITFHLAAEVAGYKNYYVKWYYTAMTAESGGGL